MNSTQLKERVTNLLGNSHINDWERGFAESILQQLEKGRTLSQSQHNTIQKVEGKYSAEKIESRRKWGLSFTDEMRENMKIVARYYYNNPPYFGDLVMKILSDPEFIPTEKQYAAMTGNKYAQRVLENVKSDPKFPVGTIAKFRKSAKPGLVHINEKAVSSSDVRVMIIEHPNDAKSAARGAKTVVVLPFGSNSTYTTEERYLKK
jgi:hypothetical protein